MSDFVDQVIVKYSDPVNVKALFSPPADATHTRLKALFAALHDLPFATLQDVATRPGIAGDGRSREQPRKHQVDKQPRWCRPVRQ